MLPFIADVVVFVFVVVVAEHRECIVVVVVVVVVGIIGDEWEGRSRRRGDGGREC